MFLQKIMKSMALFLFHLIFSFRILFCLPYQACPLLSIIGTSQIALFPLQQRLVLMNKIVILNAAESLKH